MFIRSRLALIIVAAFCAPALGEDKYTFHESLKPGQKISIDFSYQDHEKTTTTPRGKPAEDSDVQTRRSYKVTMTVLDTMDGSATKDRVEVEPGSVDATKTAGGDETVTPSSFIGKKIILTRKADGTATNDFKEQADPGALDMLNTLLTPDQDFYPDHPVAVGESWDTSDQMKKHAGLGKEDKLQCVCRLDWVKTIDQKQMAQMTYSLATVRHDEDHVESDCEESGTLTIDVAAGQIVKTETASKTKYSTPADEPTQVTGTAEDSSHGSAVNEKTDGADPEAKP